MGVNLSHMHGTGLISPMPRLSNGAWVDPDLVGAMQEMYPVLLREAFECCMRHLIVISAAALHYLVQYVLLMRHLKSSKLIRLSRSIEIP